MKRIGLIAGNGKFPIFFAQAAKAENLEVIAVAIREETSKDLQQYVDKIYWISVGELKKLFEVFQNEKLKKVAMAGQIRHNLLFKNIQIDEELKVLLEGIKDKKTDTLLGAIADRLKCLGIKLINSVEYLSNFLAPRGVITKRKPTAKEWEDIYFGQAIAKKISCLDIGQTVVVKDKTIVAVEAMEGTDETIKRAGVLAKNGIVVVKLSKGRFQDMRFDVPVVGPRTIDILIKTKGSCLAIESAKTLIIERQRCLEKAEANGISIVGI